MIADALNEHLPLEINAHIRYNGQAQILAFHGYEKLAERYKEASEEEFGHANKVMRRIQQLGGWPNYTPVPPVSGMPAWNVEAMYQGDLAFERRVLESLTAIIETADDLERDVETDNILRELVSDTSDDIEWYTRQLMLINEIGLANYLQAMI